MRFLQSIKDDKRQFMWNHDAHASAIRKSYLQLFLHKVNRSIAK